MIQRMIEEARQVLMLAILVMSSTSETLLINTSSTCLPIPKHIARPCQHLNHSSIKTPNSFGETSFENIRVALDELESSAIVHCSENIKLSLCMGILPPCNHGNLQTASQSDLAANSLCLQACESFQKECKIAVQRQKGREVAFKWPHQLNCNQLPSCFNHRNPTTTTLTKHSHRSVEVKDQVIPSDMQCSIQNGSLCMDFLVSYPKSELELVTVSFGGLTNCGEPCTSIYFSSAETSFAQAWVLTWSLACLLVSLVVLVIYVLDYSSTKHPAAPVYYISMCYIVISSTMLVGNTFIADIIICDNHYVNDHNQSALIHDGTEHMACAVLFTLVYYFTVSAQTWWMVLTVEWSVCSITQTHLTWKWQMGCHVTGWGFPIIFVPSAFTTRSISADPILHMCWIPTDMLPFHLALDVGPLLLVLTIGSTILLTGFIVKLNSKHPPNRRTPSNANNQIAPSLLARTSIYIAVVMVLLAAMFCCQLYAHFFRDAWETSFLMQVVHSLHPSCYDVTDSTSPLLSVLLTRFTASMLVGIVSVGWVIQREICCQRHCTKPQTMSLQHTTDTSSFYPSLYTVTSTDTSFISSEV